MTSGKSPCLGGLFTPTMGMGDNKSTRHRPEEELTPVKAAGKCGRRGRGASPADTLLTRALLTLGQGQGGLLAANITQGKHGSVAVEERQRLVQQRGPQPAQVTLLGGRGRVHGQVGPSGRLPAVLLQPLQPPDGQLAGFGHLQREG